MKVSGAFRSNCDSELLFHHAREAKTMNLQTYRFCGAQGAIHTENVKEIPKTNKKRANQEFCEFEPIEGYVSY